MTDTEISIRFRNACSNGQLEIAQSILNNNPKLDISAENDCAFVKACFSGNLKLAQWLLTVKSDINISANEEKAFRCACANDHLEKPLKANISLISIHDDDDDDGCNDEGINSRRRYC